MQSYSKCRTRYSNKWLGRLQGLYGYFMDNIIELTMVLYDGTVVKTSEKENTDLWWAARGAGEFC